MSIARLRRRIRAWRYARFSARMDRFYRRYMNGLLEQHRRDFEASITTSILDCDHHTHSVLTRCVNGLTIGDYLSRPHS